MSQNGYCTSAQVRLALNANEISRLLKDGGASEDTDIMTQGILWASYTVRSIAIATRPDYKDVEALAVVGYTSLAYPVLDYNVANLVADWLRKRKRKDAEPLPNNDHPTINWAGLVRDRKANIEAA